MHSCREYEIFAIGNNDALEQLNQILYIFNKHTRNLDQTYHVEFAPLKYQIAEKLKHSMLLKEFTQPQRFIPLFSEAPSIRETKLLAEQMNPNNLLKDPSKEREEEEDMELELELEMEGAIVSAQEEFEVEASVYGGYSVDQINYKTVNLEDTHQFDIDNMFFDPNLFSIVNTIKNSSENKKALLDEFPEIMSLINNDLGFAFEKKK
jgi:hypothetical protein